MTKKHEPGMAYDMKKLNKVFAVLSIVFLITVFWVFLDDYLRPWKAVQIEALKIKQEKIEADIAAFEKDLDKNELAKLQVEKEEASEVVSQRNNQIEELEEKYRLIDKDIKAETIVKGRLNSAVAATQFNYEQAASHGKRSAKNLFKKLRNYKKLFAESSDRMKALQDRSKDVQEKITELKKEVLEVERKIKEMTQKKKLLLAAKSQAKIDAIFAIRNAPFLDYLDPTLKIEQIVVGNITDDRYFQHVPKVDRCITCHTFIDKAGYEDQPNPHKTHPKLDLMIGRDSPHPMKQIGCTVCHGGEGHRVNDFTAAVHMPEDEKEKQEWIEKYNWHAPHKVPQPMFKLKHTEAACIKCHTETQYVSGAPTLNEGRRNIEKFGCYACHKIEGWEDKRRPGPSLQKIASKIDKEFFKNWVWDPHSFNSHSKMPAFFSQDNNSKPEFMKKNIAEVNAIAEFIWEKSSSYKPFTRYNGGNAGRGKELIKEVGCMGCHGVEGLDEESKKVDAYAGPYLTGTGSKVSGDWLVSWLLKPSHYQEDTIMPSFRLSTREANDITAYLLSLKNQKFEEKRFEPLDKKVRDELLVTYFSAFDTIAEAESKLSKMDDRERTLELGYRSVGKYGCYSCHSIDGFEGRAPIGPELTKVGSKPLTQFGFGHEYDVEHSRDGWIKAHLLNPRRWDNGVDKSFQDILRMPQFYMSDKEAETITVALLGQVGDYIPLRGIKRLDANEKIAAEGMKVVTKYNCIGCHQIDGEFGDLLKLYEDDINAGPPRLVGEGHRVQSDWFHYFLDNVFPIRPWLKVRMPSFNLTNEERNKIVAMFQAKSDMHTFVDNRAPVVWAPGEKAQAKALFDALACTSCHTVGFNKEAATAPDLHYVKRRLRPSWVKKWLENPQAILPGTMMPSFWENGESLEKGYFGGDAQKQVDALTKYLIDISFDKFGPSDTK